MKPIEALADRDNFKAFHEMLMEKAGIRIDKDAARYMYDQNVPIMDAVLKLVNR